MKKEKRLNFKQNVRDFQTIEEKKPNEFLYDLLYVLFKRKYLAISLFIFTFVGIVFGTYLVTPIWKPTAKVRVQLNPKQQLNVYQGITTPVGEIPGINPANDVIQILTSRVLAEELVKKFHREQLWKKKLEAPEATRDIILWNIKNVFINKPVVFFQNLGILSKKPENYFADAVLEIQKDLVDIKLEEDTTVVDISVWGESPQLATNMTNALVGLLLQKNLEMSKEPVDLMIRSTQKQI